MSLFKKYMALFRRGVALTLEYRAQILIWWLTMSMPLVMLAVWLTLAQDGPIGTPLSPACRRSCRPRPKWKRIG